MKTRGRITDIVRNIDNERIRMTLELNNAQLEPLLQLAGNDLDIIVKKHRNKRSIDANAYCWVLCTKLAEVHHTSKDEIYELMLQRYGAIETDDNGAAIKISLLSSIDVNGLELHLKRIGTGHVQGKEFTHYVLLKGSSRCDTKEMSTLIDGIVSECKEMGIETMPPDELEHMKLLWAVNK